MGKKEEVTHAIQKMQDKYSELSEALEKAQDIVDDCNQLEGLLPDDIAMSHHAAMEIEEVISEIEKQMQEVEDKL
jgi:DNA repair exonuclease SbcCD ATPase subunit